MKTKLHILTAVLIVGFIFMDDEASKNNRLDKRYNNTQLVELIAFFNHMASPWW